MKPLSARKDELLVACDIQRQTLQLECELIRFQLNKIQGQYRKIPQAWKWVGPVLGLWMARPRRRPARSRRWAPAAMLLFYKLWQWWRYWRKRQ